jgi:hypothetical protein
MDAFFRSTFPKRTCPCTWKFFIIIIINYQLSSSSSTTSLQFDRTLPWCSFIKLRKLITPFLFFFSSIPLFLYIYIYMNISQFV